MNILLAFDNNYTDYLHPLIRSIAKNVTEYCNIYILHTNLTNKSIKNLKKWTKKEFKDKAELIPIVFPKQYVQGLPTSIGNNTWSEEIYFRIFAAYLLPIDRCLYLDGDVIINGNIDRFYNQNLENTSIVAIPNDTQDKNKIRLKMKQEDTYYNSGVLLMNLEYIRKYWTIGEVQKKLFSMKNSLAYPDQDFINILFKDTILRGEIEYNYMVSVAEISNYYPNIKDIKICHYCLEKPWKYRFPYKSDIYYLKYETSIYKKIILLLAHRSYRYYQLLTKSSDKRKIRWIFDY